MTLRILTIAGSDSSGGAGIQRDARTIHALGGHALTAVTSITAQTPDMFFGAIDAPAQAVAAQMQAAFAVGPVAAAKTGMLPTAEVVDVVASTLGEKGLDLLVVDPVVVSSSGARLIDEAAEAAIRKTLLPMARVATPNIDEASALAGMTIDSLDAMKRAAERIGRLGPAAVVVTGGHATFARAVDVVYENGAVEVMKPEDEVIDVGIHGSGCAFSAAVATFLGKGFDVIAAVSSAKTYVAGLIADETTEND